MTMMTIIKQSWQALLLFACLSLLWVYPSHSFSASSSTTTESRKATLLSWEGNEKLGPCLFERRCKAIEPIVEGWSEVFFEEDDDDKKVWKVPASTNGGSIASSLWPSALAGSILFRQQQQSGGGSDTTTLRSFLKGKDALELGAGLGLAGLVVAGSAETNSCLLTDNDAEAVRLLDDTIDANFPGENNRCCAAKHLDWRDDDDDMLKDHSFDFVFGTDIAYYFHLLRPIMDTVRRNLKNNQSAAACVVVGQANRDSQWDLYENLKRGCYNQLTDEHEEPWEGTTKMLLYNLQMTKWKSDDDDDDDVIDGVVPISVILYTTKDLSISSVTPFDYVATEKEKENLMMSF